MAEDEDETTKKNKETTKKGIEAGEKAAIKAGGAALGPEAAPIANVVAEVPFFRKILEGGLLGVALFILSLIALIIIGIIALISVLGPLGFGNRPSLSGNPYDSPFDCNVEYPQNTNEQAMAAYIDSIIPSGSPLRGLGKNFVSTAKAGNKNPLFIAHFAQKESSWGTAGIARSETNNPFGRKAAKDDPSINGFKKFNSWADAVDEQGPFLKRVYQDLGYQTIDRIINRYCPTSDGCDTQTYIAEVKSFVSSHTQKANGVFGADPCVAAGLASAGGPHSGSMTWPLPGHYTLSSTFHSPSRPTHNGIDMPAPEGTPIVAAADGVVEKIFVNEAINGYGVKLDHQNGIKTAYLHFMPGSVAVQLGQSIKAGQTIGKIDNTGRSTGNHLHFAVQVNGSWVNPCGGFVKC